MNNKVLIEASKVSFTVVLLVVLIGLLLAMGAVIFIGFNQKKRYRWLEGLFILPMFIPPSAIGYIILMIFGRQGWIGRFLYQMFDISIIFTLTAAVIAGIVVTFPIMYQSIKAAVLSIDEDVLNAARVYGASELTIWLKIIFPLSIQGILNGMLLSFARAFGEFGATILVAGNIPGKTQTLPMALYYAIENNDNQQALLLSLIHI